MRALGKKRYIEPKKYMSRWFNGRQFLRMQPYATFAKQPGKRRSVAKILRSLVPEPEKCTGLEIGPGNSPLLSMLPLRKIFFMEASPVLAKHLRHTHLQNPRTGMTRLEPTANFSRARVAAGNARFLPFATGANFDIVLASEVFTHIIPSERVPVLKEIMQRARSIAILDRPWVGLDDLRRMSRRAFGPEWPASGLKEWQDELVGFDALKSALAKAGWEAEIMPLPRLSVKGAEYESHAILTARKPLEGKS